MKAARNNGLTSREESPAERHAPGNHDPHNPVALYFRQMGKYVLLTPEEERELAVRFKEKKDEAAAERMITSNLRLVVKIAKSYSFYWRGNMLDLIQEGNTGLIKAVRKFDPDRGVKLSYYASFWIRAYILKYIMDNWRLVKIGTTQALLHALTRKGEDGRDGP